MSDTQYVTVLKAKHEELDAALEEQYLRPLPDGMLVQMLKRQKLRIKDRIVELSAA